MPTPRSSAQKDPLRIVPHVTYGNAALTTPQPAGPPSSLTVMQPDSAGIPSVIPHGNAAHHRTAARGTTKQHHGDAALTVTPPITIPQPAGPPSHTTVMPPSPYRTRDSTWIELTVQPAQIGDRLLTN